MIEWISNWAETIIIAVIIGTIIEMILPEGSSKKYVKVVIGVYILFTIISPVISNFTGKSLAVSDILDLNQYINEVKAKENSHDFLQQENEENIKEIYIENLKTDIKNKLKGKGYIAINIELEVEDDENYTLNKITLSANREDNNDETEEDNENNETNQNNTQIQVINEIHIQVSDSNTLEQENKTQEEQSNNLTNSDKRKIKEYLSNVYEIKEKNIKIN